MKDQAPIAVVRKPLTGSFTGNRLLATFALADRRLIEGHAELVTLCAGDVLFEPGRDIAACHFPCTGTMISLRLLLSDGQSVEAVTIGREGAVGGIVSCGCAPAFSQAVVLTGGESLRISLESLDLLKNRSPHVRDLFCRYSDALLAQVMQSVACGLTHRLDARCSRWLLTALDRVEGEDIRLSQEDLARMLGVQRTTVTAVVGSLQEQGLISYGRKNIRVIDRARLEAISCECYHAVDDHFRAVLPEVKPQEVASPAEAAGS